MMMWIIFLILPKFFWCNFGQFSMDPLKLYISIRTKCWWTVLKNYFFNYFICYPCSCMCSLSSNCIVPFRKIYAWLYLHRLKFEILIWNFIRLFWCYNFHIYYLLLQSRFLIKFKWLISCIVLLFDFPFYLYIFIFTLISVHQ